MSNCLWYSCKIRESKTQRAVPKFLLGSGCIKGVLQFSLKGLKLFTQVPLEFLSLVSGHFLRLEVLLQLRQLGLQLPHLFQSVVLLANLVLAPVHHTERATES